MRKVLLVLMAVIVTGCAEKAEYEQAVLEQMVKDKDIQDYKLDPGNMTECVVVTSSKNMPGMVPIDPTRRQAYLNYTKMLRLYGSDDPKKTLEELREEFGSPKALADAHSNYAEAVVQCMSGLVTSEEEGMKDREENAKESALSDQSESVGTVSGG